MYRLLAIDLDGTLLTPQKLITPRTRDLLCQVSETGIAIVIATGQTSQVLCHECRALPLTAPQIIENGAIVVDIRSGTILHEKLIPEEQISCWLLPIIPSPLCDMVSKSFSAIEVEEVSKKSPSVERGQNKLFNHKCNAILSIA